MRIATTTVVSGLCAFAMAVGFAAPAGAQTAEVKEKPRMYSYIANWTLPRASWAEFEKGVPGTQKVMEHALASGAIVGFGADSRVIHAEDGTTNDNWFSGMSAASVLNTLDELYKAGSAGAPLLASATKHSDNLTVSRYYGWHAGSWKGAYTRWSGYTLKADAPDDAVDLLAKAFLVPLFEKLLADGTIFEYEIDEEAVHTENPAEFSFLFMAPNAESLDKVSAALTEASKKSPFAVPSMVGFTDFAKHRDSLWRSTVTFK